MSRFLEYESLDQELLEFQKAYQLSDLYIEKIKKYFLKLSAIEIGTKYTSSLIKQVSDPKARKQKVTFMSILDQGSHTDFRHYKIIKIHKNNDKIEETLTFVFPSFSYSSNTVDY